MTTTVKQMVIYTEKSKKTVVRIIVGDYHKDICVDNIWIDEQVQEGESYTTDDWNEISNNGEKKVVEMIDDYCGIFDKSKECVNAKEAIEFIENMAFDEFYENSILDFLEYFYFTCGEKKYQWLPKEEIEF